MYILYQNTVFVYFSRDYTTDYTMSTVDFSVVKVNDGGLFVLRGVHGTNLIPPHRPPYPRTPGCVGYFLHFVTFPATRLCQQGGYANIMPLSCCYFVTNRLKKSRIIIVERDFCGLYPFMIRLPYSYSLIISLSYRKFWRPVCCQE